MIENEKKLQALVDSEDARIIECLPLSRNQLTNEEGWHFTKKKVEDIRLNLVTKWKESILI